MLIKLVKIVNSSHCYECGGQPSYYSGDSDWGEISAEAFNILNEYVCNYNTKNSNFDKYLILTPEEKPIKIIIKEFIEEKRKIQEENDKKEESKKLKRAEYNKMSNERKLKKLLDKANKLKQEISLVKNEN